MIVTDDRVAPFVGAQIDAIIYPPFTAMGLEREGQIIGGAVFNCYTGPDIELTLAGSVWNRPFLRAMGQYAFGQLGCCRVQMTTEKEAVAQYAERLGGQREGILRDKFGPRRNGIILGILAHEYRFY